MPLVSPRNEYSLMVKPLEAMRDAIDGQYKVKRRTYVHLPHPSEVDQKSDAAKARYAAYIAGAEFDEFPSQTLASTLGSLGLDNSEVDLPERLDYLIDDADGDGQSMRAVMERTASEVLQVKWQALVCEYQGLSGLDISQMSKAETDELKPRSTIKSYNRESVVDWEFERRNGVMQLIYIVFREVGFNFNPVSRMRVEIKSDLILALDENGEYYQQKNVDGVEGKRDYVRVRGAPLKWIPVLFPSDQEMVPGKLPEPLGYLGPIVDLAYSRYRVSADYKDAMRHLPPTTYTKGWRVGDSDRFREANNGRSFIETGAGAVNNLPNDVDVSIVGADTELGGYERYMDANERKVRALGGVFKTDDASDRTATEANIDSGERVARLETLADNLERSYRQAVLYCGMFEGLYDQEGIEANIDQITIEIPREFAQAKISGDDVRVINESVLSGTMTLEQGVRKLVAGGWIEGDAQEALDEITQSGPPPAQDEPQAVPAQQ